MTYDELMKRLDPYSTECDECGELMPLDKGFVDSLSRRTDEELAGSHFLQIEHGLCLNMDGYYGGFVDQMVDYDDSLHSPMWTLCHDCCVKLFEAFPNAAARLGGKGHHPYSEHGIPCCRWGWTFIRDENGEFIGTEYGDGTRDMK